MFQSLLSRLLPAPGSPTADLYFNNACGDFLRAGVTRLAPTVFASDSACLVMRHGLGAPIPSGRRRLIYMIDDEVEAGVADPSLPFLYRQKLRFVERAASRRIVPRAAVAVVSTPALAARHAPSLQTRMLHPYWSEPLAGLEHFAPALAGEGWLEMAYLGSSVHRADLDFLWPVIGAALAGNPRARFHLASRHRIPRALAGHPRVLRIPADSWAVYRAGLPGRRFHLALYPLLPSPFNQARSVNKMIEHGLVGAGAIYSHGWPEAWRARSARAGLVLRNRPGEWLAAIRHLLDRPADLRDLAAGALALAARLNRPEPQRRLWADLLGVAADAAA